MSDSPTEREPESAEVVRLDERRLLPLYSRGDKNAFGELLVRYKAPVYGYLVRCGVPPAARDDLFQEIFTKIHRAAGSYKPDRALKPWLFTIVANTVRSHYRKQRVEALVFPEERAVSPLPDAQAIAESRETMAFLEEAIGQLPFAQREVLILCCLEGMEAQEAAAVLEAPVNTIKTHLRRARLHLTRALARKNARERREVSR